jgi:hypothetical protein
MCVQVLFYLFALALPGRVYPACLPLPSRAIVLYRRGLMAGFTLPDSLELDE